MLTIENLHIIIQFPSLFSQSYYYIKPSPMTAITMDVDGLDNPERAQLLSVVDKFRTIGISKEISLPQVSSLHGNSLLLADFLAGSCWRSIERKIIPTRGFDRYQLPNPQRSLYSIRNSNNPSSICRTTSQGVHYTWSIVCECCPTKKGSIGVCPKAQ